MGAKKKSTAQTAPARAGHHDHGAFPIVGIGASAGGLEALKEFFSAMPADSGMAFLVIQHLDPSHESMMAEILGKVTEMNVIPATDGTPVQGNTVYTIPTNKYLSIQKGVLQLSEPVKQGGMRLPIDFLFHNLAQDQGERAIGIILSGTGADGTLGLRAIREAGGTVIVQDPATAQFDAMPRNALATGLVDFTLPVTEMPEALLGYVRHAYVKGRDAAGEAVEEAPDELRSILTLLARKANSDFRCYKKSTIQRRIERRMGLRQIPTLGEYHKFLIENPDETTLLARDMLIGVTSFFRDPESFEALRRQVIAPLVQDKAPEASIRVWVAGCATGEEAYTIAMLLLDELESARKSCPVQIFASDVDERALECARAGRYPESITAEVPSPYLERYFIKEDHSYQVNKRLREAVVFAVQNVISDPPFSKLDLISCRNLLIYLESDIQKKIIALFSFALVPGGYLFLGKSEGVAGQSEHFEPLSKQPRLYRRSGAAHEAGVPFPSGQIRKKPAVEAGPVPEKSSPLSLSELNQQVLLRYFKAAVVLTSPKGKILHFYGDTSKYLGHPTGEADLNFLSMASGRLATRLRQALQQASESGGDVRLERLPYKHDGVPALVNVTIAPVVSRRSGEKILAVIFEDTPQPLPSAQAGPAISVKDEDDPLVQQLETELQSTREDLQATSEELDAANEEHKAVMEELTSMNEELQSANEELETSKEEIQSVNEELTTVNSQLSEKVEELSSANNDLANLFTSTDIATIFLDTELRIKRFTPAATRLLNLMPMDVGRPVAHISQNFSEDLIADAEKVLRDLVTIEKEVQTRDGRWYTLRALPYRTLDNRIDGVVITFTDVSRLKAAEAQLREAKLFAENIVTTVREPLLVLDEALEVISSNAAFYKLFQTTPEKTEGQSIYNLDNRQWNLDTLRRVLEEVIPSNMQVEDYEVRYELPDHRWRNLMLTARRIERGEDRPPLILLAIEDVTARKDAEEKQHQAMEMLKAADQQKDEFLAMLAHELRNPMAPIRNANEVIGLTGKEDPVIVRQSEIIGRQVGHMSRLLDDLLDVSRITRSRISLQTTQFDLREVLDQAIETTQDLFTKRQQDLSYERPEGPIWVSGDFTRLVQVFYNLLINANKYTEAGGRIWLSATQKPADGNPPALEALVRIKDSGIGIAPDVLPHVFELFNQADKKQTRAEGGLGIGLTLVQRLVEMHGGKAEARSEGLGQGSEFTIRLPAQSQAEPASYKRVESHKIAPKAVSLRVMVVDDIADSAASLAELLELWGHEVRFAVDGAAALDLAREFHPEIGLLDIGMPGMNGYELARLLRQEFREELMLVALTGYGQEEDRRQASAAGFNRHLTKPIDLPALCDLLSSYAVEKIPGAG